MTAEEREQKLEAAGKEILAGNYTEAERLALEVQSSIDRTLESEREDHAKALYRLGIIAEKKSNYPQALELFTFALNLSEQSGNKEGVANALGGLGNVYMDLSEHAKALDYHTQALQIYEELNNKAAMSNAISNIANQHVYFSDYPKAIECYERALNIAEELHDKALVGRRLAGLANVHRILSDYSKALQYYDQALLIVEELGHKDHEALVLGNISQIHMNLYDFPKALVYCTKALELFEDMGNKAGVAGGMGNLGTVYQHLHDFPKALECYAKALGIAEEIGSKAAAASWLFSIGLTYEDIGEYERAIENVGRSYQIFEELGYASNKAQITASMGRLHAKAEWSGRDELKAEAYLLESIALNHKLGTKDYETHKTLADLYERQKRWEEFAIQYKLYHEIEKEVQSWEAKKVATQIEQRRQIAEREKEIAIAKAASDAQMSVTTALLYKVLPQSVATRMIDGEAEIADYFPQVSILFADIAGFTPISADMPAIVVVRFLNYVFGEFDRIIKKHGCEKIKTIGDGYMAVCGAPVECTDHAERLAAAALEMQQTISLPESIAEFMPSGVEFGIRIGLHTGSVVAGVIGEERFVYDIYSDAVNTAARMESHGEENRIHCSNDFYRHLQNRFAMTKNVNHGFVFEKRGEMEIKGKGMMRTYFLERA